MVLNKLFNKEKPPKNLGKNPVDPEKRVVNRYYLEFPFLEGTPTYLLEDSLTIGSEDADIVLEGVSPSHCSINLNQDVLSVIDHGSSEGTFVNKKRVAPGKMIILQLKDKIQAGPILIKIVERQESLPVHQEALNRAPETPPEPEVATPPAFNIPEEPPPNPQPETKLEEELPEEEEAPPAVEMYNYTESELAPSKEKTLIQKLTDVFLRPINLKKDRVKLQAKNKGTVREASNGFLRALGLVCDLLLVGIIHNLASYYFAYGQFLKALPQTLREIIFPYYQLFLQPYVEALYAKVPALDNIEKALLGAYKEEQLFILQILILTGIFRVATALLFGVSLGQALVGIRARGNFLLKRILSPARAFFGLALLPFFWIFDFPTLFSKRSLKEILSFTHLITTSSLAAFLSLIFFIPVLALALLASPVFKGFEVPKPVPFSGLKEVELAQFTAGERSWTSKYFQVGLPGRQISYVLPKFNITQAKGKKTLAPSLIIADKSHQEFELKLLKDVSLARLLEGFARSNPLTNLNFPRIHQLVNDASNTSASFKDAHFSQDELAQEIQSLLQSSLSLVEPDIEKAVIFLRANGPFLGAFVDFRMKLLSLMGENPESFEIKQIGNVFHIVGHYVQGGRLVKKLLPINAKRTKLYEVSHSRGFEPETLELSSWNVSENAREEHPFLNLVDLLSSKMEKSRSAEIFQKVYQRYYNLGKRSLTGQDSGLYKSLNASVEDTLKVLMNNSEALGLQGQDANKLTQNLNDLLKALREKDLNYFGVSAVGMVK